MPRQIARVDSNQPEFVAALREWGITVWHTHQLGGGYPDISVGAGGITVLVEIKTDKGKKLTDKEEVFFNTFKNGALLMAVKPIEAFTYVHSLMRKVNNSFGIFLDGEGSVEVAKILKDMVSTTDFGDEFRVFGKVRLVDVPKNEDDALRIVTEIVASKRTVWIFQGFHMNLDMESEKFKALEEILAGFIIDGVVILDEDIKNSTSLELRPVKSLTKHQRIELCYSLIELVGVPIMEWQYV